MNSYKAYMEYKNSDSIWIDEVPSHWDVTRIKHIVSTPITDGPHSTPNFIDDGIPFVSAEAVSGGYIDFDKIRGFISEEDDALFCQKYRPKINDVYMVKSGATTGVTAIVETDKRFNIWSPLAVMRCNNSYNAYFLLNSLRSDFFQKSVQQSWTFGTQQNIGMGTLENLTVCFPPIDEQIKIAAFLDHETSRIDRLIAKQQQLIELLKEKRQAVISHAVTKGLNPDAPMKDSGVEWLGQVPEHWDVARSKTVLHDKDDRSVNGDEELLTVSHLTGVTLRSEKDVNMFQSESLIGYKRCSESNFVVNTMWAWMGAMGVCFKSGVASPSYNVYRVDDSQILPLYLELLCRTPEFISVVTSRSKGIWSSRLRIYPESLYEIRLALPPLNEQKHIVEYVERQTGNFASVINKANTGIQLMQERRTALISAAVTGKIDLRGWVPPVEEVAA